MAKRQRFTADFKARVVLAALRGDRTVRDVAAEHGVHPNQVSWWKRKAREGLPDVFECGAGAPAERAATETVEALHKKIDRLQEERDFLKAVLDR